MKYDSVKDSGDVVTTKTGAQFDPAGGNSVRIADVLRWLPVEALGRVTQHYINGAKKYEKDNWRKGIPAPVCLDKAARHLWQYINGDRTEDHLSAVVFHMFSVLTWEETDRTELLDWSDPAKTILVNGTVTTAKWDSASGRWSLLKSPPLLAEADLDRAVGRDYQQMQGTGDWAWACAQMDAGRTVQVLEHDPDVYFRKIRTKYCYHWQNVVQPAISSWKDDSHLFKVVEPPPHVANSVYEATPIAQGESVP